MSNEIMLRLENAVLKQTENLDTVVEQIGVMTGTMSAFAKQLSLRPTKRQFYFVVLVVLVGLLLNLAAIERNARLTEKVQSCTDPGGECYQRGQAQTAEAVNKIIKTITSTQHCDSVDLINELATVNHLMLIPVPQACVNSGG